MMALHCRAESQPSICASGSRIPHSVPPDSSAQVIPESTAASVLIQFAAFDQGTEMLLESVATGACEPDRLADRHAAMFSSKLDNSELKLGHPRSGVPNSPRTRVPPSSEECLTALRSGTRCRSATRFRPRRRRCSNWSCSCRDAMHPSRYGAAVSGATA